MPLKRFVKTFIATSIVAFALSLVIRVAGPSLIAPLYAPKQEDDSHFPERQTIHTFADAHESVSGVTGWPSLFGPTHNSVSSETPIVTEWRPEGPRSHWRLAIGSGYSSPIVVRDRVIVLYRQQDEEIVACLAAETGETIWEHRYPTTYKCDWPPHSSGPYSTPASDGERVYALSAQGLLNCLTLRDGKVVWSRQLSEEYQVPELVFAVGHSPLIERDRLILNVGGSVDHTGILAINKMTGETIWGATDQGASYSTPAAATIHGRRLVFVLTSEGLVSLDPADGHVFWTIEFKSMTPREAPSAVTPLVYGDIVLASVYQAGTICLRIRPDASYEELWRHRRTFESQYNPLVCIDGYLYGFHFFDKSFRCIDLTTGRPQWKYKSILGCGTQLAVDGRFILFGIDGHLGSVDINPNELKTVSLTDEGLLEQPCYSAPALHNGLLYLRNEKELLCLNLRDDAGRHEVASR